MDTEQMRRETDRMQAETIYLMAQESLREAQSTPLQNAWQQLKLPLTLLGIIIFGVFPVLTLAVWGFVTFLHWLKAHTI